MTPFCSRSREATLKSEISESCSMLTTTVGASRRFTQRLAQVQGMHVNSNTEVNGPCLLLFARSPIQRRNVLQNDYCKLALRMERSTGRFRCNLLISKEKLKIALAGGAWGTIRANNLARAFAR
jgi:hypothetical protein